MRKQNDQSRELFTEEKHLKCSVSEALNAESQNPVSAEQIGLCPNCVSKENNV